MEAFGILAALPTAVQAVALITPHVLPTGYDLARDAASDYGVGPCRGWFWLQAVAGGLGCLALGIALAQLHPFTPAQVVVALIVTAGARLLVPFFAADQNGEPVPDATRDHSHGPGGHRLRPADLGGHPPVVHIEPLPRLARGRRRPDYHPLGHAAEQVLNHVLPALAEVEPGGRLKPGAGIAVEYGQSQPARIGARGRQHRQTLTDLSSYRRPPSLEGTG